MTTTLAELLPLAASLSSSSGLRDSSRFSTWTDADRVTAAVAHRLIADGVRSSDRVVVLHPKSTISWLAVHAILRAGAIAVPVDPLGPPEAIARIVESVEPKIIVTTRATWQRANMPPAALGSCKVVVSDDEPVEHDSAWAHAYFEVTDGAVDPAPAPPDADDPAYIIFTSGSTGRPKGIVHTHRSALAYAKHAAQVHRLDPTSVVAGTSPLHFDMSTLELYAAPLAGSSVLTLGERDLLFMTSLAKLIVEHAATHLYAVPYLLKQMLSQGVFDAHDFSKVTQVSFGGEQFSPGSLRRLVDALPHAEFLNVYGPAEVNGVVSHSFGRPTEAFAEVPIGTVWPGVTTRIIDEAGADVPVGGRGELLVCAESAMVGYWQMPERTAESFVADGERFYRTGDRVHLDQNNVLHFHGRNDNRVKVRGVRLELEEIEQVVADAPGVDVAVVGVVERQGREHVHVWLTTTTGAPFEHAELVSWCRSRLPSAAVPAESSVVADLPTTQSGKVDRRALVAQLTAHEESANDR